ncbi:MAG: ABC transporter substrate-binding protein [Clostridium sp.]|nr:ABC transporter substrate-binding protein [Clostridium sp.]
MLKKYIAFLLAIAILVTCLAGCSAQSADNDNEITTETTTAKQTDDSNFKLSFTQADSLDPFKAESQNNQVLASLVFESLFDIDENYEITPNIATGYAYTDATTIRVDINNQLKFSDGSSVSTEDVIYSSKAAMKSAAYGNSLSCISYVEANGNSVIFKLKYANPYAINLLTFPIASTKDDEDGFPIGSGRYCYKLQDGNTVLTVNRNSDFDPYITTITLLNIASEDSIDNAVNIGNISFAFRDMSQDISKRFTCAKKTISMNNLVYIGINSSSGITSNSYIRKAINLAVDRASLVENAYSGYATAANSVFNPEFKAIENINLFSENADISSARQAIVQSAYSSKKLKLSILVNKNENKLAAANLIKSQLELAGFKVTIDKESQKNYTNKIKNGNFDIYIGEVKLGDDMSLYPFFDSKGGVRYGINNKKNTCDDLYTDFLSGKETLDKFILAFNDELPYIPLLYKKGMLCYSKALHGDIQGYYGNYFSNIDSWNFES